jgi:hypothetical protein
MKDNVPVWETLHIATIRDVNLFRRCELVSKMCLTARRHARGSSPGDSASSPRRPGGRLWWAKGGRRRGNRFEILANEGVGEAEGASASEEERAPRSHLGQRKLGDFLSPELVTTLAVLGSAGSLDGLSCSALPVSGSVVSVPSLAASVGCKGGRDCLSLEGFPPLGAAGASAGSRDGADWGGPCRDRSTGGAVACQGGRGERRAPAPGP